MGPVSPRLDRKDPYLSIHHTTLFVRDQDCSLRFYVGQLGFNLVFDARPAPGERWVAVAPPDGTTLLALVAPKPGSEEYQLVGASRQVVLITEDVRAKYEDWSNRGVRFHHPPRTAPGGGMFTSFSDEDGNAFALIGFDEVSRHIEAQRLALSEKLAQDRRTAQELEIARQVQARLFPQSLPRLRTLEYAGVCLQARVIGGDYYDFLDLGHERLGLVVGDISGKGIAASLLMANLQANVRSQCAIALDQPRRLLQSVNQLFYENTTDSAYATLVFAEYDDARRHLRYASCGHLSPLLLRADGTLERLDSTATVLGLFKEWDCAIEERQLSPGDVLALYTDGVTEAFNQREEQFGEARLVDTLRRHRELPAPALLDSILGQLKLFSRQEQQDDITLIIARCLPPP